MNALLTANRAVSCYSIFALLSSFVEDVANVRLLPVLHWAKVSSPAPSCTIKRTYAPQGLRVLRDLCKLLLFQVDEVALFSLTAGRKHVESAREFDLSALSCEAPLVSVPSTQTSCLLLFSLLPSFLGFALRIR